jgi:formylglycine-generating enzyme required for sulfatase activity
MFSAFSDVPPFEKERTRSKWISFVSLQETHLLRDGSLVSSPRSVRAGYGYWDGTGNRDTVTGFRVARAHFDPNQAEPEPKRT